MNLALGLAGLVLGLVAAIGGVIFQIIGLTKGRTDKLAYARGFALMCLLGAGVSVFAMQHALLTNDTTVKYVATNGSSLTPFPFDVSTMWSALEGSILLWALILAGYVVAVAHKFRRRLTDPLVGWAMLVLFAVSAFFFALMLGPSQPFQRYHPAPGFDGPGPNVLLQNHILVAFHPPMLYLGFVGFTVPFAFAIAALVTGRVGEGWLVETRRWTLFAYAFLTAGIILGAWWSYEVLGWGGYWSWDPVEVASFMPWLTASAYIHSVMVQERRGMLRVWNLSLLCSTFSLTILGTFLTRSGVVESVHAFSESDIGAWLLTFFGVIVAVSVGLIMWRGDRLRSPGRIDSPLSREGAFMANNLLFGLFAFICVLGVTFPLIVSAFGGGEISVGEPFFDRMAGPIGLALLFLMGVAPVLPWRRANVDTLRQRLWWPAWCGLAALALAIAVAATGVLSLLAFAFGGFAAGSAFRQLTLATRRQGLRGLVGRANGGMVVHLGVIMLAVGIVASQSYPHQGEFDLKVGQTARVDGHTLTYVGSRVAEKPTHHELIADVRVDGGQIFSPRINQYTQTGQDIGTPSVDIGLTRDVYLSLQRAATASDTSIGLRVVVQPLIEWLWVGGLIMVIGIAMAAFPGRRRDPLDPVSRLVGAGRARDPEPEPSLEQTVDVGSDADADADADSDPDEEPVPIS